MEILKEAVMEWLREILRDAVTSNIESLFGSMNTEIGNAAALVSEDPAAWNGTIYGLVRNLSDNVMIPIAGVVLTFVMVTELIRMVTERNAFSEGGDTFMFFKWIMKSAVAVVLVSNTWNIIMSVFEIGGNLVSSAAGSAGDLSFDTAGTVSQLSSQIGTMDAGELLSLWISTGIAGIFTKVIAAAVLVASFSRMIEIYLYTSAAPIPFAMLMGRETEGVGTNYLRSIMALGFQAFLMMLCMAIYGALIASVGTSSDPIAGVWTAIGYGALLSFALFRTGSLSKSIFNAR